MTKKARQLFCAGALCLLLSFLFPLWTISLDAPQYPEGIGLRIWLNAITGQQEQDLHNINGLNHYIGMKTIEPDSIPELRILPLAVLGMSALGLLGAALGRRWILGAWMILLLAGGAAGMADFWLWEYEYGHELNPDAAIKVPGMSYQPPFIGTRQLLNMRTTSLPGLGTAALAGGLLMGGFAWRESRRGPRRPRKAPAAVAALLTLLLMAGSASCGGGPREIKYRSDSCARCRMILMDARYGAELVTRHGKALVFDSVECLAAHTLESPQDANGAQALLVTPFDMPGQLVPAEASRYLLCPDLPSPMGLGLSATVDLARAESLRKAHGGHVLDWPGVVRHVRSAWKIP